MCWGNFRTFRATLSVEKGCNGRGGTLWTDGSWDRDCRHDRLDLLAGNYSCLHVWCLLTALWPVSFRGIVSSWTGGEIGVICTRKQTSLQRDDLCSVLRPVHKLWCCIWRESIPLPLIYFDVFSWHNFNCILVFIGQWLQLVGWCLCAGMPIGWRSGTTSRQRRGGISSASRICYRQKTTIRAPKRWFFIHAILQMSAGKEAFNLVLDQNKFCVFISDIYLRRLWSMQKQRGSH